MIRSRCRRTSGSIHEVLSTGVAPFYMILLRRPLTASEFLTVVQDVTTWALSYFECFHARQKAENLPTGVRIVADFYSTMMPRHLPPFASESDVRTLRKTAEPGLRAAAVWWAEALLAKQEAYKM